ncbi:hypothetical protein GJ496_008481 [Pomphorhynchus laevis]|nr:hypothetical protein GJ496_008481 [Pomphorhynchus laevis]
MSANRRNGDVCYKVTVVMVSFLLHACMDGITNAYSVFLPSLIERFNCSRAEACTVASILSGCTLLFGPLANLLNSKLGCRITLLTGSILIAVGLFASVFATSIYYLYVSYGIIEALGFSFTYLPSIIAINNIFNKKRFIAVNIAVYGSGFGTAFFSLISGVLIRTYGFRRSFLLLSALLLNTVPASLLINKNCKMSTELQKGNDNFWMFLLSNFLSCFAINATIILLVDFTQTRNLLSLQGEILIGFVGIFGVIGRVLFGMIADVKRIKRIPLYNICLILIGVINIIIGNINGSFIYFVIYTALHGFLSAGYITLTSFVLVDIVGSVNLSQAFGLVLYFQAFATILGPPFWGHLFDVTRSYMWSYTGIGLTMLFSGIMLLPIKQLETDVKKYDT